MRLLKRLATALCDAWHARPQLVSRSRLTDLMADAILANVEIPGLSLWPGLRQFLAGCWYHRPIITTHARYEQRFTAGMTFQILGQLAARKSPTPQGPTGRRHLHSVSGGAA